jgi:hypothetical protein
MPKKRSKSQELRDAVKNQLVPFIHSRGFEDDTRELFKSDPYSHLRRRFMRWNGDKLELLEIQFDKHGSGKFVFNMGIVPSDGVECYKHYDQLEVDIVHLSRRPRLYASKYFALWFGLSHSKIDFFRERTADRVIDRAMRLFPQVEAWLREGIVGPNISGKSRMSMPHKK